MVVYNHPTDQLSANPPEYRYNQAPLTAICRCADQRDSGDAYPDQDLFHAVIPCMQNCKSVQCLEGENHDV